ncbi:MAG: hypothetical protein JST38_02150 [Bacteroidetes bacterium]|nr:hypothetical protein [Bacteroidota bacterium]
MTRLVRHRMRIAVLVIVCLLFQQTALAVYLCPMEQMPVQTTAMAMHCADMGMAQKQDNPALCEKHCSPDVTVSTDAAKLSVPPLALPPLVLAPVYVPPVSHVAVQSEAPIARSDPPPRLRFCSLLI